MRYDTKFGFDVTAMEFVEQIIAFAGSLDPLLKWCLVVLAYTLAPACLVPISLVAYVSGLLLDDAIGLLAYLVGYTLSICFYYYLVRVFSARKMDFLVGYISKWQDKIDNFDIVSIAIAALFLPYLPLIVIAALMHVRLWHLVVAVLVGAFPSFYFMFQAGSVGRPVDGLYNPDKILMSVAVLATVFVIQFVVGLIKNAKKN